MKPRAAFAIVLAVLVVAVVNAQPPAGTQPKKEPDKKEPDKKEPDKKEPEIKWPTDINGKDIKAVMKDMDDKDPTIREFAARTLPLFGPPAQKGEVSKLLLKRMGQEKDPGVRVAVYNTVGMLQFDNEADNKEALRLLGIAVDEGFPGGIGRLNAVQAIAMFGSKGSGAIGVLTGKALADPSYQTRQAIANALGRVGFSETSGPNMTALTRLADNLARDESAAVRTEALQALMLLGAPWAETRKPDDKGPVKTDPKSVAVITKFMRVRIGDPKTKTAGLEKDKQVEIWARLVLMRFDPKEMNDENLDAFAKYLTGAEMGVKLQALQAIGIMGEYAAKKLDDVVRVMNDKQMPRGVVATSVNVLIAMGAGAKPAIPELKKLAALTRAEADKKKDENEKKMDLEFVKLIEAAIKHIDEAKPISPAVGSSDPKKP